MTESILTSEVAAVPGVGAAGTGVREAAYEEKRKTAKLRRRVPSKEQEHEPFEEQSSGKTNGAVDEMHQIDSFA